MRHAYPSPPITPSKPLPSAPDTLKKAVQATLGQRHPRRESKEQGSHEGIHVEPQERASRTIKRRSSFSDRTRSLTRRLSFFRDQPGKSNSSSTSLAIQRRPSHDDLTPKQEAGKFSSSARQSPPHSQEDHDARPKPTSGTNHHDTSITQDGKSPTPPDFPLRKYQSHDTLRALQEPPRQQMTALAPPKRTSSLRSPLRSPVKATPPAKPPADSISTNSPSLSSPQSSISSPNHIREATPPPPKQQPKGRPLQLTLPTRHSSKVPVPAEPISFTNPASSSALIEFLAASPPPSTPLHLSLTFGPDASSTPAIRKYKSSPPASPAPPAPGGPAMVERLLVNGVEDKGSKRKEGRLSWKRVLRTGKKKKMQGEVFHGLDEKGEWIHTSGER